MREKGIFLENRVQLSLVGGQLADISAVKNNFAGVSSFKAADNAEGCGLVTNSFSLTERFRSSRTMVPSKLLEMCTKSIKGWFMFASS